MYQENQLHESDEYNQPIHLNEVKRALSLLHNNNKKWIFKIRTRSNCNFIKGLFATNTTSRGYTNSMECINFNQHRQRLRR